MTNYFVSYNIVEIGGRGIVGCGNTIVTLNGRPITQDVIRYIEREIVGPNLPPGLSACTMNIQKLEH